MVNSRSQEMLPCLTTTCCRVLRCRCFPVCAAATVRSAPTEARVSPCLEGAAARSSIVHRRRRVLQPGLLHYSPRSWSHACRHEDGEGSHSRCRSSFVPFANADEQHLSHRAETIPDEQYASTARVGASPSKSTRRSWPGAALELRHPRWPVGPRGMGHRC